MHGVDARNFRKEVSLARIEESFLCAVDDVDAPSPGLSFPRPHPLVRTAVRRIAEARVSGVFQGYSCSIHRYPADQIGLARNGELNPLMRLFAMYISVPKLRNVAGCSR